MGNAPFRSRMVASRFANCLFEPILALLKPATTNARTTTMKTQGTVRQHCELERTRAAEEVSDDN